MDVMGVTLQMGMNSGRTLITTRPFSCFLTVSVAIPLLQAVICEIRAAPSAGSLRKLDERMKQPGVRKPLDRWGIAIPLVALVALRWLEPALIRQLLSNPISTSLVGIGALCIYRGVTKGRGSVSLRWVATLFASAAAIRLVGPLLPDRYPLNWIR